MGSIFFFTKKDVLLSSLFLNELNVKVNISIIEYVQRVLNQFKLLEKRF